MKISQEVKHALLHHQPVVALESTIISHGMPYPKNVETALRVEQVIRNAGCIPATIGIIEGEPIIGMSAEEIEMFGKREGIVKVSRRDLPIVYAKKMWGATTVAATMILARQADIEVFVTGGIGGVHRHGNETFDISADLQELSRTDVTVVCAGAKAILDLQLTMEYLETMGVPVLGYQTKELPAFYTRKSGIALEYSFDTPLELAMIIKEKRKAHLHGGLLITNPIPEEYALDENLMNQSVNQALKEADEKGIHGKDVTPFLLRRVVELTGGESLESNIQLVLNNARLGAEIAKELCKR
ncbi:pseudouridine-5'-phosphate glycosidase [Coprobacillus sp. CAG:826]|nr:pseudouridine-5'-phosphate glycosidase [Coprobacillus sp. CAG:826]